MLQEEKVKIYQLSKPIVDLLPTPIYKLNNPIYSVVTNTNTKANVNIKNLDNWMDIDYYPIHPINYYHNNYFIDFPVKYYYIDELFNNRIVNTLHIKNKCLPNFFYPLNKLHI